MNKSGKILALGLVLVLLLAACGGSSPAPAAAPQPVSAPPSSASASVAEASSAPQPQQVLQGYMNLIFDRPDGFEAADETNSLFTAPNAPEDASSITVVYTEKSAAGEETFGAKEEYEASLQAVYRPIYGEDTAYTIDEFEEMVLSGRPALYYTGAIAGKAVNMQQATVLVETEGGIFTLTYTDASQDAQWIEEFKASARGVTLEEDAVQAESGQG